VRRTRDLGAEVVEGPASAAEETVDDLHRLGARHGADGVDQRAAGADAGGADREQAPLFGRHAGDVALAPAPAHVRTSPQGTEPSARGVDKRDVERLRTLGQEASRLGAHDLDAVGAEAAQIRPHRLDAARVEIDGRHPRAGVRGSYLCRLDPGRRAEVEDRGRSRLGAGGDLPDELRPA